VSENAHREREGFFRAAKVIASLTLTSRVFGMVRDMAIASLGASRATGAFVLAQKIPNLFRRLFGEGALAAAFVPVFTETSETDGLDRAMRLFANALGLVSVCLVVLTVLVELGLLAWGYFWPGGWDRQLLVGLLSIMLPFVVTVCLLALGSAALNCRGRFAYPAFAPILLNIFIIAAAWFVGPALARDDVVGQLYIIAPSITLAGVVQLVGVLWLLRSAKFPIRPRLRPVEPGIKPMVRLMGPMILGLGLLQICELLNDVIAWVFSATAPGSTISLLGWQLARPLDEGVLMRVYAAQRMYQFPMGVLAISLGVAVFPLLSRYAARGDLGNLRDSLNRALRLAMMEGLAAGVGLFVLAGPIVRLIFVRGNFTSADAAQSAFVLQMYLLGMWAYCTSQIFLRAFYSLKDTVTPLKVAVVLAIVNLLAVLGFIWVPQLGSGAFGLAMAMTGSLNAIILALLLRKRLGPFGGRKLAVSVGRTIVACGAMVGVIYLLRRQLGDAADGIVVAACVPAGAVAFVISAWILRAPELGELVGAMARGKDAPDEKTSDPTKPPIE